MPYPFRPNTLHQSAWNQNGVRMPEYRIPLDTAIRNPKFYEKGGDIPRFCLGTSPFICKHISGSSEFPHVMVSVTIQVFPAPRQLHANFCNPKTNSANFSIGFKISSCVKVEEHGRFSLLVLPQVSPCTLNPMHDKLSTS
ncbi:hypothetical protein AYI70_g7459 [Smittium culicis]|uniref:Uncharacterized protein n=1 Tax=Smittium culicis TaxID=133412 RepID=A0A1R1XKJ2_9FUNG|nr:hypothetical protein AYI70_g7459 [Smittium culicis]